MAGASAADVRSILSIGRPSLTPQASVSALGVSNNSASATPAPLGSATTPGPTSLSATGLKPRKHKPEGISRELYALIGPSSPSINAQLARPKFKPKPKAVLASTKATKWEWREFSNSARKDGLKLGHWVKVSADPGPNSEYPFTKYNIKSQTYTYSQDEYNNLLQDAAWTKEETDYLFELVREYDLRFYVVADRYEFPGGSERTLEDLKDRYYAVCKALIRSRPWPGDEADRAAALAAVHFDKEREVNRKRHLAFLNERTPEELREEEALALELRRLEQTERAFARSRDSLLRRLAGVESGLPGVAAQSVADEESRERMLAEARSGGGGPIPGSAGASAIGGGARKKKQSQAQSLSMGAGGVDLESPLSSVPPGSSGLLLAPPGTPTRRLALGGGKGAAHDALHCIHRTDGTQAPGTTTKNAHSPAYPRGHKLPIPRATAAPRVAQVLGELGLPGLAAVTGGGGTVKLVMPTRENVVLLEGVVEAAGALVEMKKVLDRVEQELRVARARMAERSGVSVEGGAEADVHGVGDGADAEGDAGTGLGENAEQEEVKNEADGEAEGEVDAAKDSASAAPAASTVAAVDDDADADADGDEDDADADGETDRGASMAPSQRSASRKRMKRSASTSSAGSAATATTATTATGRTSVRKRMRT